MAAHFNTLPWKILWTEEPGGQSMASQRGGHDCGFTRALRCGALFTHSVFMTALGKRYDSVSQSVSSVVSNSLRPHELQHSRPRCPSPTPGVHSDSRPSSQ